MLTKFVSRPEIQIWSTLQNIKKGQIKNPLHKSVYKHGYYGIGKYTARKNNVKTEEYIKWFSMFVRCYDKKYLHILDVVYLMIFSKFCRMVFTL